MRFSDVVEMIFEMNSSSDNELQTDGSAKTKEQISTRSPAKARFGQPYGKNGRLRGHIGETGSRNMAATQKINSLTLVSYSLLQTVFR